MRRLIVLILPLQLSTVMGFSQVLLQQNYLELETIFLRSMKPLFFNDSAIMKKVQKLLNNCSPFLTESDKIGKNQGTTYSQILS